ncbi:hypothetical protein GW17_00053148 [Ensete ventricosum]|nr:hypothetical protein GW17_00053148 [Ensete ventricosum]
MDSLDSSSDVRFVPSVRLKGTSLGSPKASTSGSSSGVPTPIDAKSQRDLEVMKACHDFDLAVIEGSLTVIRKHYSIAEEYALHALLPEQQPYNLGSFELNISVNALEADLGFPLHPIIEECLGSVGLLPITRVGRPDISLLMVRVGDLDSTGRFIRSATYPLTYPRRS